MASRYINVAVGMFVFMVIAAIHHLYPPYVPYVLYFYTGIIICALMEILENVEKMKTTQDNPFSSRV